MARKGGKDTAENEDWTAVRLPVDVKEYIRAWAQDQERSVSYVLRRLAIEAKEAGRREKGERL